MQTSSVVLLPLELPNYTPRILVVGGSAADQADPTTPATANTFLLDLSQVSMLPTACPDGNQSHNVNDSLPLKGCRRTMTNIPLTPS
jgi:hypothetical protein